MHIGRTLYSTPHPDRRRGLIALAALLCLGTAIAAQTPASIEIQPVPRLSWNADPGAEYELHYTVVEPELDQWILLTTLVAESARLVFYDDGAALPGAGHRCYRVIRKPDPIALQARFDAQVAEAQTPFGVELETGGVLVGTAPLDVAFQDLSEGPPDGWEWDFGDGSPPSAAASPVHRYVEPGAYTVTLTVHRTLRGRRETHTATAPQRVRVSRCAPVTITIDNGDGGYRETGDDWASWSEVPYSIGADYRYLTDTVGGPDKRGTALWAPEIAIPGIYRVTVTFRSTVNRTRDADYFVTDSIGNQKHIVVDQRRDASNELEREVLGEFVLLPGRPGFVLLDGTDDDFSDVADAAFFTLVECFGGSLVPIPVPPDEEETGGPEEIGLMPAIDGAAGFFWKPVSGTTGRLVMAFPAQWRGIIARVALYSSLPFAGETFIEEGEWRTDSFDGNRSLYDFSLAGPQYPPDIRVLVELEDGRRFRYDIPDPGKLYD